MKNAARHKPLNVGLWLCLFAGYARFFLKLGGTPLNESHYLADHLAARGAASSLEPYMHALRHIQAQPLCRFSVIRFCGFGGTHILCGSVMTTAGTFESRNLLSCWLQFGLRRCLESFLVHKALAVRW